MYRIDKRIIIAFKEVIGTIDHDLAVILVATGSSSTFWHGRQDPFQIFTAIQVEDWEVNLRQMFDIFAITIRIASPHTHGGETDYPSRQKRA